MTIGESIFCIIVGTILYFMFGMFVDQAIEDNVYYENPLWKLPNILLWPFALIFLVTYSIGKWIESVIDYYKEKK